MSETVHANLARVRSRGGWGRYFASAGLMLALSWAVYLVATGLWPGSLRALAVTFAEATGFYSIALIVSWVVLRFSRQAGWGAWVLLIGLMTAGIFLMPPS